MALYIPVSLGSEIKSRLQPDRVREFLRPHNQKIPAQFETEVVYSLYGEHLRARYFLFDGYVLIEHLPEGRKKHYAPNREIPDSINKMIKERMLVAHLHSHPNSSCITRLENLGIHPSYALKRIEESGGKTCQPSLQCFSDSDLNTKILELGEREIEDKTKFVEVLYCEPEDKFVGFRPFDKRMAEIVLY